jgi:hypothetical protein
MERIVKPTASILTFLLAACAAWAVTPGASLSSYEEIPKHNAFNLHSPPQQEVSTAQQPLPKLLLTGITTILGNKLALLKALPANKPGEQGKEQSFTLTEGQRDGYLQVLEIDEHAGRVKVSNSGTVMTLTFEHDSPKPPTVPPSTASALTSGRFPSPMSRSNAYQLPAAGPALPQMGTIPTRQYRLQAGTGGIVTPETGSGAPTPAQGPLSNSAAAQATAAGPATADSLSVQDRLLLELQREAGDTNPLPLPSGVENPGKPAPLLPQ